MVSIWIQTPVWGPCESLNLRNDEIIKTSPKSCNFKSSKVFWKVVPSKRWNFKFAFRFLIFSFPFLFNSFSLLSPFLSSSFPSFPSFFFLSFPLPLLFPPSSSFPFLSFPFLSFPFLSLVYPSFPDLFFCFTLQFLFPPSSFPFLFFPLPVIFSLLLPFLSPSVLSPSVLSPFLSDTIYL